MVIVYCDKCGDPCTKKDGSGTFHHLRIEWHGKFVPMLGVKVAPEDENKMFAHWRDVVFCSSCANHVQETLLNLFPQVITAIPNGPHKN